MQTRTKFSVSEAIDNSKLGGFQWGIMVLCTICLIMDGFDVQAMGYVAPALIRDWQIPNSALGPVFSAALFGVLIGSLGTSMLADRIGRRPVLIGASLYFSALTLLTARASTVNEMLLIRFLAGIGLGGIMPNTMALVGEYAPARLRITAMVIVSNGFNAGAALGGFVAAWLIPAFGWRSVFLFGGLIPLVIATLMFFLLPESLQFLVVRKKSTALIAKWLKRVDPAAPVGDGVEYTAREESKKGVPAANLFREGRATVTLLMWVMNFTNLLNLYFLSSWIPTVVRDLGFSTQTAVLAGATVQMGGTIGTFFIGWLTEKFGFVKILMPTFLLACVSISFIGYPGLAVTTLFVVVFLSGLGIMSGQSSINSLSAVFYPTDLRSTGIGFGLGIGRMGAIVGPFLGGQLMALKWTNRELFLAAAVPALISALMIFLIGRAWRPARMGNKQPQVLAH
ncbi:MAG: MFS transporter [Bryobacteraceae bacterium]